MVACSSAKPPAEETPSSSTAKPAPPPMPRHEFGPNEKVVGSVDILTAVPATQSESEHLLAQGWAASTVAGVPVTVVALLIDGKVVAETRSFDSRSDVGAAFGRPEFEKSGWKIEAPIKKLGPGRHPVTVRATSATRRQVDPAGGHPLTLVIRPESVAGQGRLAKLHTTAPHLRIVVLLSCGAATVYRVTRACPPSKAQT
jgi:hypothetical protein